MKNIMKTSSVIFAILLIILSVGWPAFVVAPPALLNPLTIPKWVNQLDGPPPVYAPTVVTDGAGNVIRHEYKVNMTSFTQQVLPLGMPMTPVWGYGGEAKDAVTGALLGYVRNSPAPSFEAIRGIPNQVTWINNITTPHMFPVDPTLHWADPNNFGMPMPPFTAYPPGYPEAQSPVPLVTHLHGGEVQSYFDGGPDEWFTWDGKQGPGYSTLITTDSNAAVYYYPNMQQPATLWYHDHALGVTRINVMSGLAGFYLLRDPADPIAPLLPSGKYEVPLAIQDRSFYADGSFWFPTVGINPTTDHPYWMPEFFGDTIMVNGKIWPNMNVDRAMYRLRLLDGSNARFYTLAFIDQSTGNPLTFIQIGSDGGYLISPAKLTQLTIAPGERADILIDFRGLLPGTKVLLKNTAPAPFPAGVKPDPNTVSQIMQFTVTATQMPKPPKIPPKLNPTIPKYPSLPNPTAFRTLTLWEVMGVNGPLEVLLNGQKWSAVMTEFPIDGTTEEWIIINLTADTHPIHLHLVQFQIISRQSIAVNRYTKDWLKLNAAKFIDGKMPPFKLDAIPTELPVGPYLQGMPTPPPPNEQGWKDTIQMNPGEATVIRVRFAAQDGTPYPFDPSLGPGYVWHCHIIDHEDNEMMRPYKVVP